MASQKDSGSRHWSCQPPPQSNQLLWSPLEVWSLRIWSTKNGLFQAKNLRSFYSSREEITREWTSRNKTCIAESPFDSVRVFQVIQWWTNHLLMQEALEMPVQSLGWEDPLEEGMATHSSILAWRIPWTEEPGVLRPVGSQRIGHVWGGF